MSAPAQPPAIAIDLGGTQIRACLVADGQIHHRRALPTDSSRGVEAVLHTIAEAIEEVARVANRGPLPVGIASPGPLDPRSGIVYKAPNLIGWRDVPLGPWLAERLGQPVFVGNDANCAALGEHRFGAGRGAGNLCYVTLSTGIGGGVIIDGRIFEGTRGAAGEVGHMTLDIGGPVCNCGNVGCWEILASGTAIAAQARDSLRRGDATLMADLAPDPAQLTASHVTEAARRQDPVAASIMQRAGTITGFGLVNLAHLFDPDLIILGGGVMHAGDLILEPARTVFATYAMPNYQQTCSITVAALGDDVGLLGAAAYAADRLAG